MEFHTLQQQPVVDIDKIKMQLLIYQQKLVRAGARAVDLEGPSVHQAFIKGGAKV